MNTSVNCSACWEIPLQGLFNNKKLVSLKTKALETWCQICFWFFSISPHFSRHFCAFFLFTWNICNTLGCITSSSHMCLVLLAQFCKNTLLRLPSKGTSVCCTVSHNVLNWGNVWPFFLNDQSCDRVWTFWFVLSLHCSPQNLVCVCPTLDCVKSRDLGDVNVIDYTMTMDEIDAPFLRNNQKEPSIMQKKTQPKKPAVITSLQCIISFHFWIYPL